MSSGGCCGGDSSAPKIKKKGRFAEILLDEQLYLAFEDYLRGEFSDENLHFYKDTFPFEATQETTKPSTELKAAARLLSNKYLGLGTEPQVLNIPPRMVDEIKNSLKAKKFDQRLFQAARNDVESVLRTKYLAFADL